MIHIIVLVMALHSNEVIGRAKLVEKTFNDMTECKEYIEKPEFKLELSMVMHMVQPRYELPVVFRPICDAGIPA